MMADLFRGRVDWIVAGDEASAAECLASVYGYASGDEYLKTTGDTLMLIKPDYELNVTLKSGKEEARLARDWVLSPASHFRIAKGA